MPTVANKPKSVNFEPAPEGTHMGRCYQFIHIGTIEDEYMGKPKIFNKIRLSFELPEETKVFKEGDGPKPISVHKEFTLSMAEKANLRKFVEGVIGTSLTDEEAYNFDVETLVGMPCLLTIKHKTSAAGNKRDEIASASRLMKGQVCPPQYNPTVILSYSNWNQEIFDNLPEFIRNKIEGSEEYKNMFSEKKSTLTSEDKEHIAKIRGDKDPIDAEIEAHNAKVDKEFDEISVDDIEM